MAFWTIATIILGCAINVSWQGCQGSQASWPLIPSLIDSLILGALMVFGLLMARQKHEKVLSQTEQVPIPSLTPPHHSTQTNGFSPSNVSATHNKTSESPYKLSPVSALALELTEVADAFGQDSYHHQTQRLGQILTELQRVQVRLVQVEKMTALGQMVASILSEIEDPINFIQGNLPYIESYIHSLLSLSQAPKSVPNFSRANSSRNGAKPSPEELEFMLEDLPRVLNSLKAGAGRIQSLVKNLEHFYRPDDVGMKLADLHDGLNSTLVLLQNRYLKRIDVVREFGDLPLVECHINQLNQVFLNLLTNAIEALLDKQSAIHRQITIATRRMGADRVVVTISDNGKGIPFEVQRHLFEPFYTTKPSGIGTGLGLSIAHLVVTEVHHGRLYCCSAPNEGTTFIIELPIHQPRAFVPQFSMPLSAPSRECMVN